jgi:hypothetical protein
MQDDPPLDRGQRQDRRPFDGVELFVEGNAGQLLSGGPAGREVADAEQNHLRGKLRPGADRFVSKLLKPDDIRPDAFTLGDLLQNGLHRPVLSESFHNGILLCLTDVQGIAKTGG